MTADFLDAPVDAHLRRIFVNRLDRLVRLRKELKVGDDINEKGRKLIDHCIDATVDDCEWAGVLWQARDILKKLPKANDDASAD